MAEEKPLFDMSDVDADGIADWYAELIGREDKQTAAHKARSYALLEPRPGQQLLEVGCGTGEDVLELAKMIGPRGLVVGVDSSVDLLAKAMANPATASANVEFRKGDAQSLSFPDGTFDGCRAELVLQHLGDPTAAIAEMVRVTRPRGRIVIIDADFDTITIDATDTELTRAVVHRRADLAPNGLIARRLRRLMLEAGLEEVQGEGLTFTCTDLGFAAPTWGILDVADLLAEEGRFDIGRVERWKAELIERAHSGRFFLASTGYLVFGRRPS